MLETYSLYSQKVGEIKWSKLFFSIFSICLKKNRETSQNSDNVFYSFSDWVEILWGFTIFFFKQILKVSASYLEKQKVLSLKKNF